MVDLPNFVNKKPEARWGYMTYMTSELRVFTEGAYREISTCLLMYREIWTNISILD